MIFFYILIFAMPLVRHSFWSEFVGDLTVVKYVGGAALLYAFLYLSRRKTPPSFFATWQARWFLLFASMALTSYVLWGLPRPFEESPFMNHLSFLLLFFVAIVLVDSVDRLRLTMLAAVGSIAYASLHAVREWQKYGGMSADYRPGWVTGDPNYFTISALICLPFAYHLLHAGRPMWENRFYFAALLLTLFAIALAASRGGFLGLIAVAVVVLWRAGDRKTRLLAPVVMLVVLAIAPSSIFQRLFEPTIGDQGSADMRTNYWHAGLHMLTTYPLTGIGAGNFRERVTSFYPDDVDYRVQGVAHNTYVQIAAEMGYPGIIAFLAILLASFWSLERVRRKALASNARLFRHAAEAFEEGLLGYAVAAFFVSAQYHKLFWLTVFLTSSLVTLSTSMHSASIAEHGSPGADGRARTNARQPV